MKRMKNLIRQILGIIFLPNRSLVKINEVFNNTKQAINIKLKTFNLNANSCCWIELQTYKSALRQAQGKLATDDDSSNDADNPKK